ncbi:Glucans biosynthesis protein C [Usitatibacter rugosus]|uniref:Glucans biosynthesis protein C n=1 Tax=Usitatibacter rugosus TaxID=2732067 RepID=A0A6M4GQN3_9PROT|nr:acyltransferase [Usitatibacter rugosus]QJR09551.1 Glucans biosynthesis protein C [Usitatibacter rugosus]
MKRRHDIDALRAFAFALLILYHWAMVYIQDWGYHVKSSYTTQAIEIPMLFVNRWRMDLIFLISGVATAFMMRSRAPGAFVRERAGRLMIPLLFGMAVVVPIQPYAQGVMNGLVEPGFLQFLGHYYTGYPWPKGAFDGWREGVTWNHLWYLAYLFVYTMILAMLGPRLRGDDVVNGAGTKSPLVRLRGVRLVLYPVVPLLLYTLTLQYRFPETHNLVKDWYVHAVSFTMFLYGYWLGRDEAIWTELARIRKATLGAALIVFITYILLARTLNPDNPDFFGVMAARTMRNLYIWLAICTILGWGHALLNKPFKWLPFATEAVYPWYILHQSLIVLLAYWLIPLKVGPVIEPALILVGTVAGCWALHVVVIRRSAFLRTVFGIPRRRRGSSSVQITGAPPEYSA